MKESQLQECVIDAAINLQMQEIVSPRLPAAEVAHIWQSPGKAMTYSNRCCHPSANPEMILPEMILGELVLSNKKYFVN